MKIKWILLFAGAALVLAIPCKVLAGACTSARFHNWQNMGCNQLNGGAGCVPKAKCPDCHGMPQWWVSEPYVSLCLSDTPLSYTMSSGHSMDFSFYYKQDSGLPDTDEIPTYYQYDRVDQYPTGPNCGTNAYWGNNWIASIQFWDAKWESSWETIGNFVHGPNYGVFSHTNYEALLFQSQGGLNYFYCTNNGTSASLRDPKSQMRLIPSYGNYPPTNQPPPDVNGIYWGTNTAGFTLIYPDGSQDIFGFVAYANSFYLTGAGCGDSTARAYLSQRIDPQGRIVQLGYEKIIPTGYPGLRLYRVKYVVDPDSRTNTFFYTTTNSFQIAEIEDPYGGQTTLGYSTNGLMNSITDAATNTSSFQYSPTMLVTNPIYCYDDSNDVWICGYNIVNGNSAGWMTSLTTPYGPTTFNYYEALDSTTLNGVQQRALYVTEPEGAQQLYYYLHKNSSLPSTLTSPSVSGQTFDDGSSGSTGHQALYYRNTFHWGRRQFTALSSSVQTILSSGNLSNALANLTTADFYKADLKHWLLSSIDDVSITESLSSEQDPSPDTAGQISGLRMWYNYSGKPSAELSSSDPQISCIARLLPDDTSQYTTYNYYPVTGVFGFPPGSGFVSDNESSYTMPSGGVGELTNWFTYAANSVDLISVSNSFSQYVNLGYNGYHQINAITNALNQVATLGWDDSNTHNLTGVQFIGGASINLTLYSGQWVNNNWVPSPYSGFVQEAQWSPQGRTLTFNSYNFGLPTSVTDDRGVTLGNTWDGLNRLTGITFPDETTISNIYNRLDLVATKDRLGNWTSYVFDGLQHLTTITNANNAVTTFDWCGCGSLSAIYDAQNGMAYPTYLNYDNQGNLTNITYPDNSSLTYQFDLAGRMTNAFDGAGRNLQLSYNNQGLPTSIATANGALRQTIYDALNRPTSVTDANGVTVINQFDTVNELLKKTWPDGVNEGYGYSAAGLIAYTNRDQKVTHFGRDGAGRLTSVTNANTEITQFGYDSLNNLVSLIDGLLHQTTWQYNQYGWLTNKIDGLNRNTFRFTYNANGWVTNRWTPEKGNTSYSYDNVGNLKSIVYPQQTITYAYDALDRLTNMVDAVGTTAFSYTPAGRIQSENGPWTNDMLTYTYIQGLRTALTLSQTTSNWSQSYGYDSGWRLKTLTSPAGSFTYSYNFQPASALVTGVALPNGANIVNSYDSLARLTGTVLNNYWGHTLDGYSYTPDALGLRTNIVRNLGLTSSTVTAGFDNIGQLTSWNAAETGGSPRLNEQFGFGYDSADNLHLRTNGSLMQSFTVDAANELTNASRSGTFTLSGATPTPATSVTVNGQGAQTYGDFTFASTNNALANGNNSFAIIAQNVYGATVTNSLSVNLPTSVSLSSDNNGSLTNDGARTFAYDSENQLTNITLAGQWRSDFVYDGLNRQRIARDFIWQGGAWVFTNETHYIYDGLLLVQERDTNNNSLVTYTRGLDFSGSLHLAGGIGGLLARTDTNSSTFFHADGSGNITTLIDGNENIAARYLYNPFGKLVGQWGPLANVNTIQFSSMPQRRGIALFPFRGYEPDFQRFLNQDPIGEYDNINLYAFVGNDSIDWIDSDGLAKLSCSDITGLVNKNNKSGLDDTLIKCLIYNESRFDPSASNGVGDNEADGLMQIRPAAIADVGGDFNKTFDPAANIQMGTKYLAELYKRYHNNLSTALRKYGPGGDAYGNGIQECSKCLKNNKSGPGQKNNPCDQSCLDKALANQKKK